MNLLNGKCGLVTDAGSGIGRASAITLAKEGAKVMVSDILESGIIETVKIIEESGGIAQYCSCDISKEEDVKKFKAGITLDDGYLCKEAKLEILNASDEGSDVMVTIQEGKFHQVKRMFEAVGKTVVYLKRTEFGTLPLDEDIFCPSRSPIPNTVIPFGQYFCGNIAAWWNMWNDK